MAKTEKGASDELRCFVVTPIQTNCYAYVSEGACMVVDPGGSGAEVASALGDVAVELIVATHGHGDHVGGVAALKRSTGAPFAIHPADAALAGRAGEVSEIGIAYDDDAPAPDIELHEGDTLRVGSASFEVIETPGHTPGGVVLLGHGSAEGVAFVGDTLFPGSHGRTDLEGGDERQILSSLSKMGRRIPPATQLFCGHGPATTMASELSRNPFIRA